MAFLTSPDGIVSKDHSGAAGVEEQENRLDKIRLSILNGDALEDSEDHHVHGIPILLESAMGNFHSPKKFDPYQDIIDLSGKVVIVTGGK